MSHLFGRLVLNMLSTHDLHPFDSELVRTLIFVKWNKVVLDQLGDCKLVGELLLPRETQILSALLGLDVEGDCGSIVLLRMALDATVQLGDDRFRVRETEPHGRLLVVVSSGVAEHLEHLSLVCFADSETCVDNLKLNFQTLHIVF